MLLRHVARRIEEYDGVAERIEYKRNRDGEHNEAASDQNEASPLAGQGCRIRTILSPSL